MTGKTDRSVWSARLTRPTYKYSQCSILTNDKLSVLVAEDVEVVAVGGVVAILHHTRDLPLPVSGQVALHVREQEGE